MIAMLCWHACLRFREYDGVFMIKICQIGIIAAVLLSSCRGKTVEPAEDNRIPTSEIIVSQAEGPLVFDPIVGTEELIRASSAETAEALTEKKKLDEILSQVIARIPQSLTPGQLGFMSSDAEVVLDLSAFPSVFVDYRRDQFGELVPDCTSAMIGEGVLLTAAHCVDKKDVNNKSATRDAKLIILGTEFNFDCEMFVGYSRDNIAYGPPRNAMDIALCSIRENAQRTLGSQLTDRIRLLRLRDDIYENLSLDFDVATADVSNEHTVVGGYGCYAEKNEQGDWVGKYDPRADRKYRVGSMTLDNKNNVTRDERWMVHRSNLGDDIADICRGDSGGPMFRYVNLDEGLDSARSVIGVNSANVFRVQNHISLYADPHLSEIQSWITGWISRNNAEVCGITQGARNCWALQN